MAKWIRVEYESEGNISGYQEFDLERINRVQVGRRDGKVEMLLLFYRDEPGTAVKMDTYASTAFLAEWEKYVASQGGVILANEASQPGLIQLAGESLPRLLG